MPKKYKYFFILFGILLVFTTCKKYPENTLWFKDPSRLIWNHWTLESFIVNGTDSTGFPDMKMYTEKGIDFSDNDVIFAEQYQGSYELLKKKKKIKFGAFSAGGMTFYNTQKNIFRGGLTWTIEKLRQGQFWISVNNDNIKYEIRFKN